jgi:4-amino-4-deoxy-L-arabinose transferase-like glycosyltransferase
MSAPRTARTLALAWGIAAFLGVALLAGGPGISREEARVLAAAGAAASTPGEAPPRPPLPALLARASEAAVTRVGLPHLLGYRLPSALTAGLLAGLLALLALELGGPLCGALAPALLLSAPRLLLPLVQAGPAPLGAALALAALVAYRQAVRAVHRPSRLGWALGAGALFGLALATQLEAVALLAAVAVHAAFLAVRAAWPRTGPAPAAEPAPAVPASYAAHYEPARPAEPVSPPEPPLHPRSGLLALAAMAAVGPALALALWPALWADPVHRLQAAVAAVPGDGAVLFLGRLAGQARPPWGYPLLVSALALPAALVVALAGGLVLAVARLFHPSTTGAERSEELLFLLAAVAPLAVAQAGLAARAPGPAPWFAAFAPLCLLAARAIVLAAHAAVPSRSRTAALCLALVALAPGAVASLRAYPDLGASWGELGGGVPGAASLGMPRHDGEAVTRLLAQLSARAAPGARIHWPALPPAALAVYAADGRLRSDLTVVASLDEADLAVVSLPQPPRQEEYEVWAALHTTAPASGVFLDEVPLAWVYARPGAWR